MRELLQVGRGARRWQALVGVRWQRVLCRLEAFYFLGHSQRAQREATQSLEPEGKFLLILRF